MSELAQEIHRGVAASSIKRASIDVALTETANSNLIAAVAGKRIAVLGLMLTARAGTYFGQLRSSTTKNLTGQFNLSNLVAPIVLPPSQLPWLITNTGEPLNLSVVNGTNRTVGFVLYAEVD